MEESEGTFFVPNDIALLHSSIVKAKKDAIDYTKTLGMNILPYDDEYLIRETEFVIKSQNAKDVEGIDFLSKSEEGRTSNEIALSQEETMSAI